MSTHRGRARGSTVRITDLHVQYPDGTHALRGVGLAIDPGSSVALVGESGSGKTTIARALLGLLPAGTRASGVVEVDGVSLIGRREKELRRLRGRRIGYVAQNPFGAMNPLWSVARNVEEAWRAVGVRPGDGAVTRALEAHGIDDAARRAMQRPHHWSGGMLQRAAIAAAVVHDPLLLVADEPTSALDAALADQIVREVCSAASTVLLITHDLDVVAPHVDRVLVCYGGQVVEDAAADEVVARPRHPYTGALLAARLRPGVPIGVPLPGSPPSLRTPLSGCSFAPRCPVAEPACRHREPTLTDGVACLHPLDQEGCGYAPA